MAETLEAEMTGVAGMAAALGAELAALRADVAAEAAATRAGWCPDGAPERAGFAAQLENLAAYLALRRRDLTGLQAGLAGLGLSSLGRSEAHVLGTLDAVTAALAALAGRAPDPARPLPAAGGFAARVAAERDAIFGADPHGPQTRIMATLPSGAAEDPALVAGLIGAGATALRINCAYDTPEAWRAMAALARAAAKRSGTDLRIVMDLAGPKVRLAEMRVTETFLAREKPGRLKRLRKAGLAPEREGGRFLSGDRLRLVRRLSAEPAGAEAVPSHPELLIAAVEGARIWFDDGKLPGRIVDCDADHALVEFSDLPPEGVRLKPGKGVNLPGAPLGIPALDAADLEALDIVAEIADAIGFSFVQVPQDIRDLRRALAERLPDGRVPPALVLKIETGLAVANLPRLIAEAGAAGPVAVMIARGDLAVEIGLARLAEIQEEILWLCEAAGVPVVWATQVLETLAREGRATRAEATDAAMGQRAECVMLNKGPHAAEAVAFLRGILGQMDRHHAKKSARLGPLNAWHAPPGA
ncbi:pyruvate kinase [Poseidonocella sp. HB161398]|uniref:pyruvate kinase n=1 Tax=Poseidonocella sp. HB161398 TaxID=2320855 RepID=UPI00197D6B83|nr:pyruvate kinase [Poseidonocella sp. HB161398]